MSPILPVYFVTHLPGLYQGTYQLAVQGRDHAGNAGAISQSWFGIDGTSPTLTLTDTTRALTTSSLLIEDHADDGYGSGIAGVQYQVNGGVWNAATLEPAPLAGAPGRKLYRIALSNGSGEQTIAVRAMDVAGNVSATESYHITTDLQAPQLTILAPAAGATLSETFELRVQATDDFVGVDTPTLQVKFDQPQEAWRTLPLTSGTIQAGIYSIPIDSWSLIDGEVPFEVRAADRLGNDWLREPADQNAVSRTVKIDNDLPPQAPTGVRASYSSYHQVDLEWNKNSEPDLAHYRIYRREPGGTTITEQNFITTVTDTVELVAGNLFADQVENTTPYYRDYALKAVDRAGNMSAFSEQINVPPPDAPGDLRAIGRNHSVELDWRMVREGFVKGYIVFCRPESQPEFTSRTTVLGRATTAWTDTTITNGQTFHYYVRAIDGADNASLPSNIATATPETTSSVTMSSLAVFEDRTHQANNDWDFNDVGAKIKATFETTQINQVEYVKRIVLDVEGYIPSSTGYSHDVYLGFAGFQGTGRYHGYRWLQNNNSQTWLERYPTSGWSSSFPASGTLLYQWDDRPNEQLTSTEFANKNISLFLNTNNGGAHQANGEHVKIILDLDSPTSNPLSAFDTAPFDTWINVRNTGYSVHIYDPFTDVRYQYDQDNNLVTNDADQGGVYLNCGLAIPKLDWAHLTNTAGAGLKMWLSFPDFIDYAKTVRTGFVKNPSWYLNFVP